VQSIAIDPQNLRGVEVDFWHPWEGEARLALRALVARFSQENEWGIQVRAASPGNQDDLSGEVAQALAEGGGPDLVVAYPFEALGWQIGDAPAVVDINPLVNDPAWGLSTAEQADFYSVFWQSEEAAGKRLGVPALRSAGVLFYNQSWAEELGFAVPPVTPEHFREQVCAAAEANRKDQDTQKDGTGGYTFAPQYPNILGWLYAFGAQPFRAGDQGYDFETAEVEAAFRFLRSLQDAGCAALWERNDAPESEFAARRWLFISGSLGDIPSLEAAFRRAGSNDRWTILPYPSPLSKPAVDVYGPSFYVLAQRPEEQLASWLFMRWLLQPENLATLAQATGSLPARASATERLGAYANRHPQWAAVIPMLPLAVPEPPLASWKAARWAVADAVVQLTRYYFSIDQVAELATLLQRQAAELHAEAQDGP
jgi:ABC-type glycerol-3-phosphate transport system substrate-binding protein